MFYYSDCDLLQEVTALGRFVPFFCMKMQQTDLKPLIALIIPKNDIRYKCTDFSFKIILISDNSTFCRAKKESNFSARLFFVSIIYLGKNYPLLIAA